MHRLLAPHRTGHRARDRTVHVVLPGRQGAEFIDRLEGTPVLLVHGYNDTRIPYRSAQRVFAQAKNPKDMWLVPDGDHFMTGQGGALYERLSAFTRSVSHETRS